MSKFMPELPEIFHTTTSEGSMQIHPSTSEHPGLLRYSATRSATAYTARVSKHVKTATKKFLQLPHSDSVDITNVQKNLEVTP